MTPDTVRLFADYNSKVNSEMISHISKLDYAGWEKNLGGYYESIKALCAHVYIADFSWLTRFSKLRPFDCLDNPVFSEHLSWDSAPFDTIDEYTAKRMEMDTIFISLAAEIRDEDLNAQLEYKNLKGEDQNRNFGGLLFHVFNHQTHHRGMISLYLEILGIPNDYSNLARFV
jgi:uncharacterized damage-inducible protein DinB